MTTQLASSPVPERFQTILADPPWDVMQVSGFGAHQHYRLMTVERIMALPVADLAEANAHLWLWVTNATLRNGYDVMEAWGFTPRSILTWIKPYYQLGNYLRNATEHLLFGTRGRAPVHFRAQSTWVFAPKQDHSHKPEEQYAIIERVSCGPFLELFARRHQPGWYAWGNEIDSDIKIPGYPVPSDGHTDWWEFPGWEAVMSATDPKGWNNDEREATQDIPVRLSLRRLA